MQHTLDNQIVNKGFFTILFSLAYTEIKKSCFWNVFNLRIMLSHIIIYDVTWVRQRPIIWLAGDALGKVYDMYYINAVQLHIE